MAYRNIKQFNLSKMGTRKGWCLKNCRLAFSISTGTFASAKADMLSQKKNGTLHPLSTLPTNCSVPVYIDTSSTYEHIVIYHKGTYYSDGSPYTFDLSKAFGWGELCDGVRVVEKISDSTLPSFLPPRGYWTLGDNDPRINELSKFMRVTFPSYTPDSALGSYYGKNIQSAIKEFQRRTQLTTDGCVGKLTYAKLKEYGFNG